MNEPTKTQQLTQFLLSLTPDQRKKLGYLAESWPVSQSFGVAIAAQLEVIGTVEQAIAPTTPQPDPLQSFAESITIFTNDFD